MVIEVKLYICTLQCKINCFLLEIFSLICKYSGSLSCVHVFHVKFWVEWASYKFLTIPLTYVVISLNTWRMYFLSCLFLSLIEVFLGVFEIGSPWINWDLIVRNNFSAGTETLKTALQSLNVRECHTKFSALIIWKLPQCPSNGWLKTSKIFKLCFHNQFWVLNF